MTDGKKRLDIHTLAEAQALIRAADFVQEEKLALGTQAAGAGDDGDFDSERACRYASRCLQRVEDKLRNAARPVPTYDAYSWRSKVRE